MAQLNEMLTLGKRGLTHSSDKTGNIGSNLGINDIFGTVGQLHS